MQDLAKADAIAQCFASREDATLPMDAADVEATMLASIKFDMLLLFYTDWSIIFRDNMIYHFLFLRATFFAPSFQAQMSKLQIFSSLAAPLLKWSLTRKWRKLPLRQKLRSQNTPKNLINACQPPAPSLFQPHCSKNATVHLGQ